MEQQKEALMNDDEYIFTTANTPPKLLPQPAKNEVMPDWDFSTQGQVVDQLVALVKTGETENVQRCQLLERGKPPRPLDEVWFPTVGAWLRTKGVIRISGGHTRRDLYPSFWQRVRLLLAVGLWESR